MNCYDVTIIGGGIIGLASAYKILEAEPSLKLAILEKEDSPAKHQSGHNSNVIHSGIYYKPGSLKAVNCISGYSMMISFCKENQIPFELCGKFIVSVDESEENNLNNLYHRGIENGLSKIEYLSQDEIYKREPNIRCLKGIYIPYTGITDFREVSKAILTHILAKNGKIFYSAKVESITRKELYEINTTSGSFKTKYIINCAGLYSDIIAKLLVDEMSIKILPFRGEYYWINETPLLKINSLIYPVPNPAFPFLGIHLTKTLEGRIEAGPNAVPAFRREGYRKSDINLPEFLDFIGYKGTRRLFKKYWHNGIGEIKRSFFKTFFTQEVKKFLPNIKKSDLTYGGAGVRAQACDEQGNLIDDFVIYESENSINICNAPSPAATASLSIGQTISDKLMDKINN